MSKHHHHEKCYYPLIIGGYGAGGYGGEGNVLGGAWGLRWFYALLILIVIVLQFGRNEYQNPQFNAVQEGETAAGGCNFNNGNNQLIDNSVLFIIVVFLLVMCTGCWGGNSGYGYY